MDAVNAFNMEVKFPTAQRAKMKANAKANVSQFEPSLRVSFAILKRF